MSSPRAPPPKVLLFDIGGVVVLSPMLGIRSYEETHGIPLGYINHAISASAPNGAFQRLERGEVKLDGRFYAEFKRDIEDPKVWERWCKRHALGGKGRKERPRVDPQELFWQMMGVARTPDPWMFPAVKRLKESGMYMLAALSNTVLFPDGHMLAGADAGEDGSLDVRGLFDVFISSCEVGMRKPERGIYELALREMGRWRGEGRLDGDHGDGKEAGLKAEEVLFLDDIGGNLKPAKELGMRTLKVPLGGTREVVKELERITCMKLLVSEDEKSKL